MVIAGAVEYTQSSVFKCTRCGPVVVTVPLIVAYGTSVHQWLVTATQDGTIQRAACPRCDQTLGKVDAPLLIYRPGPPLQMLFASPQGTTPRQNRMHAQYLLARLSDTLGVRAPALENVLPGVPRQLMPIVLAEGLEAAAQRLLATMRQFITSTSLDEAYHVAREHPELVHDAALLLAVSWCDSEQGRARSAFTMEERRAFLYRSREVGIDNAFAEKLGHPASEAPD